MSQPDKKMVEKLGLLQKFCDENFDPKNNPTAVIIFGEEGAYMQHSFCCVHHMRLSCLEFLAQLDKSEVLNDGEKFH